MTATEFINKDIPFLLTSDTGSKALELMDTFKISHLPIINLKKNLIGIISENEIYDFSLENKILGEAGIYFKLFFVKQNTHLFDILYVFEKFKTTIIPVLNEKNLFLGVISPLSVIKYLAKLPASDAKSIGLLLKNIDNKFSATEIANILESNKAKLLAFLYEGKRIFIKVQTSDLESLMQSLERYGFEYQLFNIGKTKYDDLYKERLDNLLHFINI